MNPFQELQSVRQLLEVYRTVSLDLVHHFTIKPIVYGGVAARIARVPAVVHTFTGLGYTWTRTSWKANALRTGLEQTIKWGLRHPNQRFVFQNPDNLNYFVRRGLIQDQQSTIIKSSGVRTDVFVPQEELTGDPVVLLPARMLWSKGVGEFVTAARQLQEQGHPARFVLVGNADDANPDAITRDQLEQWDEDGVVEWWGYQDDMVATYRRAHIVCLPSYYREGVPQVLLEAAACARPVITTDAPGCRDAVRDGETGYLVPPREPDALADRIRLLLQDRDRRPQMGNAGRAFVEEEFSRRKVVDETIQLYETLLNNTTAQ